MKEAAGGSEAFSGLKGRCVGLTDASRRLRASLLPRIEEHWLCQV